MKFKNLKEIYDQHIINDIKNKHQLAKITFKKLREIDDDFKKSKEWCYINDNFNSVDGENDKDKKL